MWSWAIWFTSPVSQFPDMKNGTGNHFYLIGLLQRLSESGTVIGSHPASSSAQQNSLYLPKSVSPPIRLLCNLSGILMVFAYFAFWKRSISRRSSLLARSFSALPSGHRSAVTLGSSITRHVTIEPSVLMLSVICAGRDTRSMLGRTRCGKGFPTACLEKTHARMTKNNNKSHLGVVQWRVTKAVEMGKKFMMS